MLSYYIMSFSIYCNSLNGTQVAGNMNEIVYNFDYTNTPAHDGGYKVYMSFASEPQAYVSGSAIFGVIRIPDLGVMDNFSPFTSFTATRQNHVMGIIRASEPHMGLQTSIPATTATGTTPVPINSGTVAHTLTTTTNIATYSTTNLLAVQTIDARMHDNSPAFLQSKPRNNQFTVRITGHDGVLYPTLTAHYAMILAFEAV
jgi:hypothetical protein